MRLEILDQTNSKTWNDINDHSRNGTLYHTWEWLRIVEQHSNSKLLPLVFFDANDEKPFGAIPLFFMKRLGLRMVFSPPPGTSITLGPIFADKGYKQHKFETSYLDFQNSIDNYIKDLGVNYIYIVTSPGLTDVRPYSWAHYEVKPAYTYLTDLSQGEEVLWGNLSRRLKQAINRTRNRGVQVIESNINDKLGLDYVYESLTSRYNQQHLKLPLKKAYLQNILDKFNGSAIKLSIAKHNDLPIGWQLSLTYKDTITGWLGTVRSQSNELEVNGMIWWDVTTQAIKAGYKWLEDMGANTPQLCSYKAKFDPSIKIYFEIKKTDLLGSLAEKAYFFRRGSSGRKYARPNVSPDNEK